jgi:hypothetical protein
LALLQKATIASKSLDFKAALKRAIAALKAQSAAFDSPVVWSYRPLFGEFRRKRFVFLWRGNREGFGAGHFPG